MLSYSFGPQLERPSIGRTFASRLRAPKLFLLVRRPKPDSYFLQILTQTSACFRCVTSPAPCHPVSSRTVMTSEWHLHPLARTRVNTCFNLTPNQPTHWAERLPAQLNPKAWTEIPRLFHNTNALNQRINKLSSCKRIFEESKSIYDDALKNSGFQGKLQ